MRGLRRTAWAVAGAAMVVSLSACGGSGTPRPALVESAAGATVPARVRAYDDVTSRALRALALGDSARLASLATEAEALELVDEEVRGDAGDSVPRISPRIRLLSALNAAKLPTVDEAREALDGGARRGASDAEAVLLTLQKTEVRSRLAEAERNNFYDGLQRPLNATFNAVGRLLQGELFGIVELFADAIDQVVSTQYADSTRREVLRVRRDLGTQVSVLPATEQPAALEEAANATKERMRLSRLHSLRNATLQEEAGNLESALWWVDRARRAAPEDSGSMAELRRVSALLDLREQVRQESLAPKSREDEVLSPGDRALYGDLLRGVLGGLPPEDLAVIRAKCLERPGLRPMHGAIQATEVAALLAQGRRDSALVLADWLAVRGGGDVEAPAIQRLGAWLHSPSHSPDAALDAARLRVRKDWWNFLVFATPQNVSGASESAEQARTAHIAWLQYVRLVFLPDMVGRLIALPIVGWPVSDAPIADAVARFEPFDPTDTRADERRLIRACALENDARPVAAAAQYRALTPPREADAGEADVRAARAALRRYESIPSPTLRADALRALYRAYGRTDVADDIRAAHAKAEDEADIFLRISRDELLSIPGICAPDALDIPAASLAEIPGEGVQLRSGNRVTWRSADDAPLTEVVRPAEAWSRSLILLGPSRRDARLLEVASKPGRILRVPLQLEATAFPGADAAPGLVPLRASEVPALYE